MAYNSKGESLVHLGAVKMRILGGGNLDMVVESLNSDDDTQPYIPPETLVPFKMTEKNAFEPTRLANYNAQRFRLFGSVDTIDEFFTISTIIFWTKVVAVQIPGNLDAIPDDYNPD